MCDFRGLVSIFIAVDRAKNVTTHRSSFEIAIWYCTPLLQRREHKYSTKWVVLVGLLLELHAATAMCKSFIV